MIVSSELVRAPILRKNEDGEEEFKGTTVLGMRFVLGGGIKVMYTRRTDSISIEYPAVPKTYRTGLPITTTSGVIEMEKPTKYRMPFTKFQREFSSVMVTEITNALDNVEF